MAVFDFLSDIGESIFGEVGSPGDSNLANLKFPEFFEDPDFRETQDILKQFGIDILAGNIPEFFAPIGEAGSPEFENYLSLLKGDITESVESGFAATGRKGGVVGSEVGRQVGEATTKARFADLMRALEGKEFLLNTGVNVTEGVRQAGQEQGRFRNNFNLSEFDFDFKKAIGLDEMEGAAGEARGKLASQTLMLLAGGVAGGVGAAGAAGATVGSIAAGAGKGALSGGFGLDFESLLDIGRPKKTVGPTKDTKLDLGKIKLKGMVP